MSATADRNPLTHASQPVVRALLDEAIAKDYESGVLGVQAEPSWEGPERFTHRDRSVRVATCPSTLAVWEALRDRRADGWLVLLTPRDVADLGGGALSHLIWNRLRTPDPWEAVRQRFSAASLDPTLYRHPRHREVATGLLAAMPQDGWPPAPGGVLTRDHALDAVVRAQLHLTEPGTEVDVTAVLEWSLHASSPAVLADLRANVGDALTDSVIEWLAERCGQAAGPVASLLLQGRISDLVPLGIVAGLLGSEDPAVARAVGHFEGTYRLGRMSGEVLRAWHADAAGLTTQTLTVATARRVLETATTRLRELGISELAENSDLLPVGLRARLAQLAREIRGVLPDPEQVLAGVADSSAAFDAPLVTASLADAERAWKRVREHHLADSDDAVRPFKAGLRLVRWLACDVSAPEALPALVERQVAVDAWVDSAMNETDRGSVETNLADVLGTILTLTRMRRDRHDRVFGTALATHAHDGIDPLGVERVLPDVVIPLAKQQAVLMVVIDGLSTAIANDLVVDAGRRGWAEYAVPGRTLRAGALAALPTLTEFSRCSLLCGELRQGTEDDERRGFADVVKSAKLEVPEEAGGSAEVPLFHKKQLDTAPRGQALSSDIQTAIADTDNRRLVAAVLNTVDDTVHHADPGGTDWRLPTIRHLVPLLEAARRAGRTVVITSDHGHVIERRDGELRNHEATYGARARVEGPAADGEVVVSGDRVLTGEGTAVLAVNERVRYEPLNAGYHGGGSPAEVVAPVVVLHAGDTPSGTSLTALSSAEPSWWRPTPTQAERTPDTPVPDTKPKQAPAPPRLQPTAGEGLFEISESSAAEPTTASADADAPKLAKAVTSSKTFTRQRDIAGRVPVSNAKITALLTSLLSAPGRRISAQQAASDLGIAPNRLRGALPLLKRVLDIEGYVVLSYEQESADVVLDEAMLREQFGVSS